MARPSKHDVRIRLNEAEEQIVREAMAVFGEEEKAPAVRKALTEWAWTRLFLRSIREGSKVELPWVEKAETDR